MKAYHAFTISGTTIVVGASGDGPNGNESGSVYVFELNSSTGNWEQTAKLIPNDGAWSKWSSVRLQCCY